MIRKGIFRFEGPNQETRPHSTGFVFICSGCMWMACGLFSVSVLFGAKRVECEEKEEKSVLSREDI